MQGETQHKSPKLSNKQHSFVTAAINAATVAIFAAPFFVVDHSILIANPILLLILPATIPIIVCAVLIPDLLGWSSTFSGMIFIAGWLFALRGLFCVLRTLWRIAIYFMVT